MHQPAVGGLLLPVRRGLYYRGRQTRYRGVLFIGAGIVALTAYGFIATLQPDSHFGRILAAYGGIFVAGSLAWGARADGFRPDRYDLIGAALCLFGVAVMMFAPRT